MTLRIIQRISDMALWIFNNQEHILLTRSDIPGVAFIFHYWYDYKHLLSTCRCCCCRIILPVIILGRVCSSRTFLEYPHSQRYSSSQRLPFQQQAHPWSAAILDLSELFFMTRLPETIVPKCTNGTSCLWYDTRASRCSSSFLHFSHLPYFEAS